MTKLESVPEKTLYISLKIKNMSRVNIESTENEYLIRIDKTLVDKTYVHQLLNLLQVEELAQRVDFDDSITDANGYTNS